MISHGFYRQICQLLSIRIILSRPLYESGRFFVINSSATSIIRTSFLRRKIVIKPFLFLSYSEIVVCSLTFFCGNIGNFYSDVLKISITPNCHLQAMLPMLPMLPRYFHLYVSSLLKSLLLPLPKQGGLGRVFSLPFLRNLGNCRNSRFQLTKLPKSHHKAKNVSCAGCSSCAIFCAPIYLPINMVKPEYSSFLCTCVRQGAGRYLDITPSRYYAISILRHFDITLSRYYAVLK